MSKLSPVLKWAGGKRQLLPAIMPLVPQEYERYYEPFVGAGAVLLELQPQRAMINDANSELINVYYIIKNHPDELVQLLKEYEMLHCEAFYYELRNADRDVETFEQRSRLDKAARTVYLNRTCYNGLYRVNKKGFFNTPMGRNSKTKTLLEKYLFGCFGYVQELLPEEWDKNPKQEGILLFNNAIGGFIRLFNDIAVELIKQGNDPKKIDDFIEETHYYLDPLQDYFRNMSDETKKELRASYGGNGPKDYWRNLERAIHNAHEEFIPEGYVKYWEDHDKSHNEDSIRIMAAVEDSARKFIVSTLKASSANWIQTIPKKVYTNASNDQSKHKYDSGEELAIEQFFSMADLSDIIQYGPNWSTYFEKVFTLPSEAKKTGGKKAKTEWMVTIDKLQRNVGRANFVVSKQQREMLLEVEQLLPFSSK